MPNLKGTEASLSYVQCFLYLVSSSINVSTFHVTWLDTFNIYFQYTRLFRKSKELKNLDIVVLYNWFVIKAKNI